MAGSFPGGSIYLIHTRFELNPAIFYTGGSRLLLISWRNLCLCLHANEVKQAPTYTSIAAQSRFLEGEGCRPSRAEPIQLDNSTCSKISREIERAYIIIIMIQKNDETAKHRKQRQTVTNRIAQNCGGQPSAIAFVSMQ